MASLKLRVEALENAEARPWEFTPEDGKNKGQSLSGVSLNFMARDDEGAICGIKVKNPGKVQLAAVHVGQVFELEIPASNMRTETFLGRRQIFSVDPKKEDQSISLVKAK